MRYLVRTECFVNGKTKTFEQNCSSLPEALSILSQWSYVSNCVKSEVVDVRDSRTITRHLGKRSG